MNPFKVGDVFESDDYNWTREVINVFSYKNEEYVVTSDSDDSVGVFLASSYDGPGGSWKLKSDVKELTMAEIAKLAGVDVNKLRIKE